MKVFERQLKQPSDKVSLKCSAVGDPLPVITWTFNDSPITPEGRKFLETFTKNYIVSSMLAIPNIATSDGGLYGCIASNEVGQERHYKRLDVYGPPFVLPLKNQTVVVDQEVVLNCYFNGYPIKSITWFKGMYNLT